MPEIKSGIDKLIDFAQPIIVGGFILACLGGMFFFFGCLIYLLYLLITSI